jgi:hypothetical protein
MKKVSIFLSSLLMCISVVASQSDSTITENQVTDVSEYFAHQKNHIPGSPANQAIKTIYIAFNIWQRDDGSGNFEDVPELYNSLDFIVRHMNLKFINGVEPTRPIEGVEYLKDSYIRFEMKSVDFYRSSELYNANCNTGRRLNDFIFAREPHKRNFLNLHLTGGGCRGASGYANFPSSRDMEFDSYVVSFVRNEGRDIENYGFWAYMGHLIHEIGHNLELHHPYNSEFCKFSHPDFLFDLFGYEKQEYCENLRSNCDVCYHQGGWDCDLTDPNNTCTNNLMGGNKSLGSITPLQMGRMHRSLSMRSVRKYAWGYSEIPYRVERDELWNMNIKFFQDIVVEKDKTLILKNTLELVPEASIILEPGARLIVDGGVITNALYSENFWQGVIIIDPPSRGLRFWKPKQVAGQVELVNGGRINNYLNE